ncbi:chorismate lyase [Thiomicrorhabdus sp. 6S2-11]|uniref:Probable chorismate pyruvate-lyase n=1 Tax=Thiomicrorhabdus marina TaxID=2818442 RepID=A0ABS3Q622_9GAMM|nr:chorismate lyase [Thiomicrorhabdus marina]MBO1927780.1 chorismate lyase [Thiomicrorhabdus marina]
MSLDRLAKIKALIQEKAQVKVIRPQFWKPAGLLSRITPSRKIHDWLKTPTSLTAKLRNLCPELEVQVLSECFEAPLVSEAQKLGLAMDEEVWIRCVLLKCNGNHWVYARTVIPAMGPHNPWQELQKLGNKPLGEVLFEMPSVKRSSFEFSKDSLNYWPHLMPHMNNPMLGKLPGFARRSIFEERGAPLLLTEVFLPGLLSPKDA